MANLTSHVKRLSMFPNVGYLEAATLHIAANGFRYEGSLLSFTSQDTFSVTATGDFTNIFAGWLTKTFENRTGSVIQVRCQFVRGDVLWIPSGDALILQSSVGKLAYAKDDSSVQLAAAAASDQVIGLIIDYDVDLGVQVDTRIRKLA
jgi:hypothetical protein